MCCVCGGGATSPPTPAPTSRAAGSAAGDGAAPTLGFAWSCASACNASVAGALARASRGFGESVARVRLANASEVAFDVVVYRRDDPSSNASARATVRARAGARPRVALAPTAAVVSLGADGSGRALAPLVGRARGPAVDARGGYDFAWSVPIESAGQPATSGDASDVLVASASTLRAAARAARLSPGVPYTFRLTVYGAASEGRLAARAEATVVRNAPPSAGALAVAPAAGGVALETAFELACAGWDDAEPPLRYAFAAVRAARDDARARNTRE